MSDSTCTQCGMGIGGVNRKFCSRQCTQRFHRAKRNAETLAAGAVLAATFKPCPICGEMFSLAVERACGGYAKRSMCSVECRAVKKRREDRLRESAKRGTAEGRAYYEAYRDAEKFAENSRRMRSGRRILGQTVCLYCGDVFEHPSGVHRQTCASIECTKQQGRDSTNRRLAMKAGATLERFTHQEVFERDKWCCQLCGIEVPKDAAPRSPMSASLDHRMPLSRGGAHSLANCQLAHLVCNLRKSNKLPATL